MTTDWRIGSIKRIAEVKLGKMVQPGARSESEAEAPYLRAAHVQPRGRLIELDDKTMWFTPAELRDLDLRAGDVVVVEGGAGFGRSAHLTGDHEGWGFQNSIVRVRPRAAASDGRYLDYFFQSLLASGRTHLEASVATIPHYTAEKVAATTHPIPPATQQVAIADFLDRETAQIDAMIEAQDGLADLFMERRQAEIDNAFNESRNTVARRLGHLLSEKPRYGVLVPKYVDDADPESVPFIRVGDLSRLDSGPDLHHIDGHQSMEFRRTVLRGGEVLLGVVGNMGQSALVPPKLAGANVARAVAVLRCRSDTEARLLTFWLKSRHFLDQALLATSSDTIQPTLGMGDLAKFEVHWPTRDLTKVLEGLTSDLALTTSAMDECRGLISYLSERREALITAAVTGRIDPETGIERIEEGAA